MQKIIFAAILSLGLTSCSTKKVASSLSTPTVVPEGALTLDAALEQPFAETLSYLQEKMAQVPTYSDMSTADPARDLPSSLKATKLSPKEKTRTGTYIRKFRAWSEAKRARHAKGLLASFTCENAVEAQALGFTLEVDFPAEIAMDLSRQMHERVITCDVPKTESYFRLAIFAIQRQDCERAMSYLKDFPTTERGTSDRLAYVKSFCAGESVVAQRNPWSGYGILLTEAQNPPQSPAAWYLTTHSGLEEWDRLLATLVDLHIKGKKSTVQYLAGKINYETLRTLPHSFQASMLVLMSQAGADLAVFQTLHRYLADHPEMSAPAVTGLLFPTRYWKEILENSQEVDPILVKALIRQESAFNPQARSRARASGLMQLIYPTAKRFGVSRPASLLKPNENIHAGARFLGQLIDQFGSVELALAAYNAGPAMVRQWQKRYPTDNIELFVEMIPYSETREYVRLVRRNFKIYETILNRPQILGDTRSGNSLP